MKQYNQHLYKDKQDLNSFTTEILLFWSDIQFHFLYIFYRAENLKKKDVTPKKTATPKKSAKPDLVLPDLPSPPDSLPNLSLDDDDDETEHRTPPSSNGKSRSGGSSNAGSPLDGNVAFGAGGGGGGSGGGGGGGRYTAEEIAVLR